MPKQEKIIKYKTNINKISAKEIKEAGFKSKAIARNFARYTNIKSKEYSSNEALLNAMKTKLNQLEKIGLSFNDKFFSKLDLSSEKVKQNRKIREEKRKQEEKEKFIAQRDKIKELFNNMQKIYAEIENNKYVTYYTEFEPTDENVRQTAEHFLNFKKISIPNNKDYIPREKKEHARKKTFYMPFNYDIYSRDLSEFESMLYKIYNEQKYTFKITFELSFLLVLAKNQRELDKEQKDKVLKNIKTEINITIFLFLIFFLLLLIQV
jgi:hypothetical protein